MNKREIFPYLTFAGSLPFIIGAVCIFTEVNTLPLVGDVQHALSIYGLVIACFMAGAHWGQHLSLEGSWAMALPVCSNIAALVLWLSYLVLDFKQFLLALIAVFVCLLLIDVGLHRAKTITSNYHRVRVIVTTIVCVSLAAAWTGA